MEPALKNRLKRFTLVQRLFHLFLMLSFLIQAATGLGRLFIETTWGHGISSLFGGYHGALVVHKNVGLFMIALFLGHIVYVLVNIKWRKIGRHLMGHDSIIPHPRDLSLAARHTGWIFFMAKSPSMERWTYWEKFDYWAVFWGIVIIGGTGILLYEHVITSHYLPGWSLNLALWVHRIEAILAICHVFVIHLFIAHLRRHNFPMDLAIFEGSVELSKAREERPAWVARLEATGELKRNLVAGASMGRRSVYYVFGFLAVAACMYLLLGGLLSIPGVTW